MDSSPPPISDRSSAPPRLRIDWNLGSQGGIGAGCSMPRVEDGLLGPDNNYALRRQQPDGTWVEAGDRWRDALRHAEILRGCWAAAA